MFEQNPETKAFFNEANQFQDPPKQRMALTNAVIAYASNIDDLTPVLPAVEIIANKHCGLTVQPDHYGIVYKNLMESIGHVLGDVVTEEIGKGWSDAVLSLANIMTTREEELYKMAEARQGGWRGVKDFKVVEKRQVSNACMEFTFEAVDGKGPIEFTTGQFLTLHLKGSTPRHYTVTNKPGESFLQCCIKKLDKGQVSNAMHNLDIGTVVGLSPPFGVFTLKERPAVLISAGIGATPMKSFVETSPEKIKLALHVDRDVASQPFVDELSAVPTHFHYTAESGRPAPKDLIDGVLKPYLAECDFFLCGPGPFLSDMKKALADAGAQGVYCDVFGPELA
jgi:nitric oxide dioxygenase